MASTKNKTQMSKIIVSMIRRKEQDWFFAGDFQEPRVKLGDELFIGWEATARMSDLLRDYPQIVEAKKQGKYRYLRFRFENTAEMLKSLPSEWITLIRTELDKSGVIYRKEQIFYEPSGENAVRAITKTVEVLPPAVKNEMLAKGFADLGDGQYVVQGTSSQHYRVLIKPDGVNSCDCPDFFYRKGYDCKHVVAILEHLKIKKAQEPRQTNLL